MSHASEQVATAPRSSLANSSSHFMLAANHRMERASWSPPVNANGNNRATMVTNKHLTHKAHAEPGAKAIVDQGPRTNHERDRRGWRRRDSSHELSLSPSSSSLDDDDDEGDQGEQDDDDQDQAADKTGGQSQSQGVGSSGAKPHVGPMGIFFKVWSLVKVTKARHNKMKRQHSEDAGQMHNYAEVTGPDRSHPANGAPGSLSSTAAGHHHQTHLTRQAHILQDGHFRRAGSQPPPSSHLAGAIGLGGRANNQQQLPLMSGDTGGGGLQTHSATGTNGSSSGVSSTTSSTIATSSCASGTDRPIARRQRPSAALGGGVGNNRGSWASRMKSRGQVVDCEPPGQKNDQRQAVLGNSSATPTETKTETPAPTVAALNGFAKQQSQQSSIDSKRQLRAHKSRGMAREKLLNLRGGRGGPLRRNSMSGDEDWAAGGEEEDEEEDEQGTLTDSEGAERDEEEDSDLNDIYSTPNDSIQSVPSGARLPETTTTTQASSQLVNKRTQPVQSSYQMTKSFSANNFNRIRLAHHQQKVNQQQQQTAANNIERIDENKILDSSSAPNGNNDDDDEKQERQRQVTAAKPTQRSSNSSSSRFFISSSSSEDSNTVQQRQSTTSVARNSQPATAKTEQVSLATGLHYHAPPPTRPDSLLINPCAPGQQRQQAPNLMTPSALIMNGLGGPVSVAAMSPMFPLPAGQGANMYAVQQQQQPSCHLLPESINYKKSPSLFEMSTSNLTARFSSKYPCGVQQQQPLMLQPQPHMSSFIGNSRQVLAGTGDRLQPAHAEATWTKRRFGAMPHSISLHDCKLTSAASRESGGGDGHLSEAQNHQDCKASEYKLAQMLLELGRSQDSTSGSLALKDQRGYTALMHAIISENLSAIKCLIEHGVDLNAINNEGQSALDLVCSKQLAGSDDCLPLEMLKLLIEHQVDLDRARESDGSRLLDRLIAQHDSLRPASDKLAYIDCLLHNGAKLGSATWAAASGKQEIQLRLLRKLCQDGYFLYKKSSIEAAVYRFEYALKRLAALEQQLDDRERRLRKQHVPRPLLAQFQAGDNTAAAAADDDEIIQARAAAQQVKYQTFLGLSRCERKRRFFKRALEFAHMSILVDSTSYEGYYSKAHILKDLGELDDALLAIDQTERLVVRSIASVEAQLCDLKNQLESIVFDGCFRVHDPQRARWIESSRTELSNTRDYLHEAKKHIAWLRAEILDDKKRCSDAVN